MAHQIAQHALGNPLPIHPVYPPIQLHIPVHSGNVPLVIGRSMFEILNNVIQPTSTLTVTTAASGLDRLFPLHDARAHMEQKEEPEAFLEELWGLVFDVAEQIPYNSPAQDTLAKLVKTLQAHPSHKTVNMGGVSCRVWADLPLLDRSLKREFDKFSIRPPEPSKASRFLNVNAFTARLTQDGTIPVQAATMWVLGGALENNLDTREVSVPVLEYLVPVAAEWIHHAGIVMFRSPKAFTFRDSGRSWRIWDRWKLWRQQFARISTDGRLWDRTRALAREAALDMAMIEMNNVFGRPMSLGRSHSAHQGAMRRSAPNG